MEIFYHYFECRGFTILILQPAIHNEMKDSQPIPANYTACSENLYLPQNFDVLNKIMNLTNGILNLTIFDPI